MKALKNIAIFFVINAIVFSFMLIVRWPWIVDNFLISDDLIYFPKAILGKFSWKTSRFINWAIFNTFVHCFRDIAVVRILYLFLFTLSASYLYFPLRRSINDNIYPLLILLVGLLLPVYADQAIFLNGSHPLLGMIFVLLGATFLINLTLSENPNGALLWAALSVSMFSIGCYCSPTAEIVSFAGMILLLYPMAKHTIYFKRILLIISSMLPPLIRYIHLKSLEVPYNHYSLQEGFTIITPNNMVTQLFRSIRLIFTSTGWELFLVFVVGMIIILLIRTLIKTPHMPRIKKIPLFVLTTYFLVFSALYFAPISIVTSVQIRYMMGPFFFLTLATGIVFYIFFGAHKYARGLLFICLFTICGLLVNKSNNYASQRFSFSAEKQNRIQCFIEDNAADWKPGSQIIFVLDKMPPFFTSGFNHWSTWYLRYITNRSDIIGLIGLKSWLHSNPVVEKYRDHGSEFWSILETSNGRKSERIKMIGIEEGRPTYIYIELKDSSFIKYNQLLVFQDDTYQVYSADEKGLSLLSTGLFDFHVMCSALGPNANTTLIYGNPKLPAYRPSDGFSKSDIFYNGNTFNILEIPPGKYANIELEISSLSSGYSDDQYSLYNDVSPPMPFLWGRIAIYQIAPNTYRIGNTKVVEEGNSAFINIKVIDKCGCMVNSSFGVAGVFLGDYLSNSPLRIGRGYKNRFWKGKLGGFSIELENQNHNTVLLTSEDFKIH